MRSRQFTRAVALVLNELATKLQTRGWSQRHIASTSVLMNGSVCERPCEALRLYAPFEQDELPAKEVVGIGCFFEVYFAEIEAFLNRVLQREPGPIGMITYRLSLAQVAPADHVYAKSAYLVTSSGSAMCRDIERFLADYDAYVQPLRKVLSTPQVFDDEHFVPPTMSLLSWGLRRMAYCKLQADAKKWRHTATWLRREAEKTLQSLAANDESESVVFHSLGALAQASARLEAMEALKLVRTLEGE